MTKWKTSATSFCSTLLTLIGIQVYTFGNSSPVQRQNPSRNYVRVTKEFDNLMPPTEYFESYLPSTSGYQSTFSNSLKMSNMSSNLRYNQRYIANNNRSSLSPMSLDSTSYANFPMAISNKTNSRSRNSRNRNDTLSYPKEVGQPSNKYSKWMTWFSDLLNPTNIKSPTWTSSVPSKRPSSLIKTVEARTLVMGTVGLLNGMIAMGAALTMSGVLFSGILMLIHMAIKAVLLSVGYIYII